MNTNKIFLYLLAIPLVFASCKEEPEVQHPLEPVFTLTSEETLNFGASGGEGVVTYTLENPVEGVEVVASANVDWIDGFEYGDNVKFEVAVNSLLDAREGVVTLQYSALSIEVKVCQAAATAPDLVLISEAECEFEAEGGEGEFEFELSNPIDGIELAVSADVDWITDVKDDKNVVTYTVVANDKEEAREGKVTLSYGDLSISVAVKQKALVIPDPELTLKSEATAEYEAEGGEGEFAYELVNAVEDTELKVSVTEDATWITDVKLDTENSKVTYKVAANDTTAAREAVITLSYGDLKVEVAVKQAAKVEEDKPALSLKSEATAEYEAEGGEGEFAYELVNAVEDTELKVSVTEDATWITDVKLDTENSKVTYKVAANDTTAAREAVITLSYGDLKVEVTVKQAAKVEEDMPTVSFTGETQKEFAAYGGSGEFTYELANADESLKVEAVTDADWITNIEVTETTVTYEVVKNYYADLREGEITLTYGDSTAVATVKQQGSTFKFSVDQTLVKMPYNAGVGIINFTLEGMSKDVDLVVTSEDTWISDISSDIYSQKVTFNVEEHTTEGDRTGEIVLTYGDVSRKVRVKQTDNFPDAVTFTIMDLSAQYLDGGKMWALLIKESDRILGEMTTRIVFNLAEANMLHITSGTYSVANGGIRPGDTYTDDFGQVYFNDDSSVYRMESSTKSEISDAEIKVNVDVNNQTTLIEGWFISENVDSATGETNAIKVSFKYEGDIPGMKYKDNPDGITEWYSFTCHYNSYLGAYTLKGVAKDMSDSFELHLCMAGGGTGVALGAGDYIVNGNTNYILTDAGGFGAPIDQCPPAFPSSKCASGGINVAKSGDQYTITINITDTTGVTHKGKYVGAL